LAFCSLRSPILANYILPLKWALGVSVYKYNLRYLADGKDPDFTKYESSTPINVGDVIECHYFHCVVEIKEQSRGVRLALSKSAHDPEEAMLLASQYGHYPKN